MYRGLMRVVAVYVRVTFDSHQQGECSSSGMAVAGVFPTTSCVHLLLLVRLPLSTWRRS